MEDRMKLLTLVRTRDSQKQRGFTLLEYCAGAAVVAGVLYVGFNELGNNIKGFMEGIGQWLSKRTTQVSNADGAEG
jgi:hypothetical protein